MNRKQFIESQGATCRNWNWSWSFINESERLILFGAWDRFTQGKTEMILSEEWRTNGRGRKNRGYDQSREHIRLVEEENYQLMTFPMKYSEEKSGEDGAGPAKIEGFTPELRKRSLSRVGGMWFAGDNDAVIPLAEELALPQKYPEGARFQVSINAYERSAKARSACIAYHGHSCFACGFDFARVYGSLGDGFIHVHHIGTHRDD